MTPGENMRLARIRSGITQTKLAEVAQVSKATISLWEHDKYFPRIDSALLVCDALGITLQEYFAGSDVVIENKNDSKIGKRIRFLRNRFGITQEDFAKRCELDVRKIRSIENGLKVPSINELIVIADVLETSVDFIVGHFTLTKGG